MWKAIEEFEEYEVSIEGEVRSNKNGKQRILKPWIHLGYKNIDLWKNNKSYNKKVARLVALAFLPNPEGLPEVDHIDNNKLNNRVENLRWCSRLQNQWNKGKPVRNKSGYKCVSFRKDRNKWRSQITINNKTTHLGCFDTAEEAYTAYCKKAIELHGEFARL